MKWWQCILVIFVFMANFVLAVANLAAGNAIVGAINLFAAMLLAGVTTWRVLDS